MRHDDPRNIRMRNREKDLQLPKYTVAERFAFLINGKAIGQHEVAVKSIYARERSQLDAAAHILKVKVVIVSDGGEYTTIRLESAK